MGLPRSTPLRTLREGSAYAMTGKNWDAPDPLLAKVVTNSSLESYCNPFYQVRLYLVNLCLIDSGNRSGFL